MVRSTVSSSAEALRCTRFVECCVIRVNSAFVVAVIALVSVCGAVQLAASIVASSFCNGDVDGYFLDWSSSLVTSFEVQQLLHYYVTGIGVNPVVSKLEAVNS